MTFTELDQRLLIGDLEFGASDVSRWRVYNGATFIWLRTPRNRVVQPYKIQGDHSALLPPLKGAQLFSAAVRPETVSGSSAE